jgi:hypothetical protein
MNGFARLAGCAVLLLLTACGGGGGSGGSSLFGGGSASGGTTTPAASDVLVSLSASSVTNAGTETVTATITAVDASRNAVSGIPITVKVDNNAVAVVSGTSTDTTGKLTATIQLGTDRTNRVVTVTATSGTITRSAAFAVVGSKLIATVQQAVITPNTAGQIQYRLTDNNSNPMTQLPILISATGLPQVTGTTDSNGAFIYNYTSPSTTGNLDITASAAGVTNTQTVLVQSGSGSIPAVAQSITSASVTASPSVVAVNSGATNNRSEIRALFLSSSNAPLQNVRVKFDLNGDVNSVGGTLATGGNIVYSDANGVAATAYAPGSRSSPTDGVTVRACYYTDDATAQAGACSTSALTHLTVTSEPLAVTIGTDNTISSGAGGLTYIKQFVVLVVDSSGQAKSGVQITPSIDLTSYIKGFYGHPGAWSRVTSTPPATGDGYTGPTCLNEDINRNGVLEAGEDVNSNGSLDPRKSDVAVSMVGSSITDANGLAILQIQYPKNVATWVNFVITVGASGISGTEGRTTWSGQLPAAASEFTATESPSFQVSPYGFASSCSNPN